MITIQGMLNLNVPSCTHRGYTLIRSKGHLELYRGKLLLLKLQGTHIVAWTARTYRDVGVINAVFKHQGLLHHLSSDQVTMTIRDIP